MAVKVDTWIVNQIVDRLHVSTSNLGVIRYMRSRLKKPIPLGGKRWRLRKRYYREALKRHAANRRLYGLVMSGRV